MVARFVLREFIHRHMPSEDGSFRRFKMKEQWRRYKDLQNKKGFVYSAVLVMNMIALWDIVKGTVEETRKISVYWY